MQKRPLVDPIVPGRQSFGRFGIFGSAETGQKSEGAKVDAHHWYPLSVKIANESQQRTISSQRNEQVNARNDLVQRFTRFSNQLRRILFEHDVNAVLTQC